MFALGCNSETYVQNGQHHLAINDYEKLGTRPGYCHHCHTGKCPVGITTQDEVLEQRLEPDVGAKRLRNYVKTMNMELTTWRAPAASPTCTTSSAKIWWR